MKNDEIKWALPFFIAGMLSGIAMLRLLQNTRVDNDLILTFMILGIVLMSAVVWGVLEILRGARRLRETKNRSHNQALVDTARKLADPQR